MTRKNKQDWIEQALYLLAEVGADHLTIDLLTERLGVTKGSFYHHFGNFSNFKTSLLAWIEERGTHQIITFTELGQTPTEKMDRLLAATGTGFAVEVALRAWALQDEEVRAYQTRVDAQRLAYLVALCGEINPVKGEVMARMLYTMYVGAQQILPPIEGQDLSHLYEEFKHLYQIGGSQ